MHAESPSTPKSGAAAGPLLGIFVGGQGRRMGGRDKAGLPAPGGGSLLSRQLELGASLGWEIVLLGARPGSATEVPSGSSQPLQLLDAPAGVGPLGGLGPLLEHAAGRPVLALACDLPYVDARLLQRIADAPAGPAVVAPQLGDGWWMPLCARYDSAAVLPVLRQTLAGGQRSFQALLRRLSVVPIELSEDERRQLRDWDTPADIHG